MNLEWRFSYDTVAATDSAENAISLSQNSARGRQRAISFFYMRKWNSFHNLPSVLTIISQRRHIYTFHIHQWLARASSQEMNPIKTFKLSIELCVRKYLQSSHIAIICSRRLWFQLTLSTADNQRPHQVGKVSGNFPVVSIKRRFVIIKIENIKMCIIREPLNK